jgi:hypothetical protein
MFIITSDFIESDIFDSQWRRVTSSDGKQSNEILNNLQNITKRAFNNEYTPSGGNLNITDLLICSRKKLNERPSTFGARILKQSPFPHFFYKNIFTAFDEGRDLIYGEELIKNSSFIYWKDSNAGKEFLIMNVDYNLMFINLATFECVSIYKI